MDQFDILIIDDNPLDSELLTRALRDVDPGTRIHVFHDAEEALQRLHPPNGNDSVTARLILIDVHLPTITGVEALQRLKEEPRTRYIPVVMLSASQDESIIEACYLAGANSYIIKPVSFERFEEFSRVVGPYWLRLNQLPYSMH